MSKFNVGFVIFPNLTQLDFTGPLQVLHRLPQSATHIAAKSLDPVPSDCGLSLLPTTTFAGCPQLDLICVPGGAGVVGAVTDAATLDFVRRQAAGARYVTAVCTGAFVLGRAGLLQGRRATTHWGYTDLLSLVGATHQKGRIVQDGNLVTAGGGSARVLPARPPPGPVAAGGGGGGAGGSVGGVAGRPAPGMPGGVGMGAGSPMPLAP